MSTLPVLDLTGKEVSTLAVEEALLESSVSQQVVTDTVVALRAGQRRGTACTKTKSEVNFSGAKPWKQKGTGRARAGERSSPIWRKGAVAFGPRPHSFKKTINKKVKRVALQTVLADKLSRNEVVVVEKITVEQPKTKQFVGLLACWKASTNAMVVLEKMDKNVKLAARNIPGVMVCPASTVTIYDILCHQHLVTTPAAWELLKSRALQGEKIQ